MKYVHSIKTPLMVGLAAACIIGGAAVLVLQRFRPPSYHPTAMTNFSHQLRTHCLGRFLIDLPTNLGSPSISNAVLYFGSDSNFTTVDIEIPELEKMTPATFEELIRDRREYLKSKHNDYVNSNFLLSEHLIETPNGRAVLFRRLEAEIGWVGSIVSELHTFIDGRHVVLKAESYSPTISDLKMSKDEFKHADPAAAEKRIHRVVNNIRPIKNPEDAPPGFCMNDIIIDQNNIAYDDEKSTFNFNATNRDQPKLSIDMNGKFGHDQTTLFERMERLLSSLDMDAQEVLFRNIRKRQVQVAGMAFEEWAHELYSKTHGTTEYSFINEGLKPAGSSPLLERPAMSITLNSGEAREDGSSPYSLPQLETAWDQWLGTLRLSPGNNAKAAD